VGLAQDNWQGNRAERLGRLIGARDQTAAERARSPARMPALLTFRGALLAPACHALSQELNERTCAGGEIPLTPVGDAN
jgi:hypothetical protein